MQEDMEIAVSMIVFRHKFAQNIRECRQEHNLSIEELSKNTGINVGKLTNMEKGHEIDWISLFKLAHYLDKTLELTLK